jgi:hypothetical protein
MKSNGSSIRLSTVEISKAGISELENGRIVANVPKQDILELRLMYGTSAERRIVQFCCSMILIALGLFSAWMAFQHAWAGVRGTFQGIYVFGSGAVILVFAGVGLFLDVLRRKYFLLVRSKTAIRKITFERSVSFDQIRDFVADAKSRFGYEIGFEILSEIRSGNIS